MSYLPLLSFGPSTPVPGSAYATELGSRILETYPPLRSTKDPVSPSLATLLRKALPAQALAITGTAKYLRRAKTARIVAECGVGKTYMALGTIHVLADGRPSTTLVMCPSHITHKWAREVLLTIPRARAFLIEDMRNGGDPSRPHGICEVKLSKGKTVYEGIRLLSICAGFKQTASEIRRDLAKAFALQELGNICTPLFQTSGLSFQE